MASMVTASPAADGLPREAGYTNGFTMLSGALLIAAVAGLLIPVGHRSSRVEYAQEKRPQSQTAQPAAVAPARRH